MNELTFNEVKPFLSANLKTGRQAPALLGKPGIGKSSLIKNLANEYNTKAFMLQVNQLGDKTDLTGIQTKQLESGDLTQITYPHTTIKQAMEYANQNPEKIVILGLDEINRTSSDITSACLSLVTERTIGQDKLPNNLRIIITGNDQGNIITLDEASLTRFHLYKVKPDVNTFFTVNPNLHPVIKDLLTKHPELLTAKYIDESTEEDNEDNFFQSIDQESMIQSTNPRTITALNDMLLALGLDGSNTQKEINTYKNFLLKNGNESPLYKAIIATTGHTTFSLKLYDALIDDCQDKIEKMNTQNSKNAVEDIRPDEQIINILQDAKQYSDINNLLTTLSDKDELNLFVWLLATPSIKEVNNIDASQYIIAEANLPTNPPEHINQIIMELVKESEQLYDKSIETLLKRNDPFVNYYRGLFTY